MNAKNSKLSIGPLLAMALLVGFAVVSLEKSTQGRNAWQRLPAATTRPLPPQLTRLSLAGALGDNARVAADFGYIDCLQYVGNSINGLDGRYKQTDALYREVLWLDPGFQHAVLEGAAVLGFVQKKVETARDYIVEAIGYDPTADRFKLYLVALAYQKSDDPVAMVEVLRPELMRPDAPEMLQRMVGNIYLKEKDWQGAMAYFRWLSGRAQEKQTLQLIKIGLEKARTGLAKEAKH